MVRLSTSLASVLALGGTFVAANIALDNVSSALARSLSGASLEARQAGGFDPDTIPSQCKSQCSVLTTISNPSCAADAKCFCTDAISSSLVSCISCALSTDKSVPVGTAQAAVDQYVSACQTLGVTVKGGKVSNSGSTGSKNSGSNIRVGAAGLVVSFGLGLSLL